MMDHHSAQPIDFRVYGTSGPEIVLLHGGPGAPGYMAPVARELSDSFRVIEPFQRKSGNEPLTVARHVADLDELIESVSVDGRPALVGHSWGAMLALVYAAGHPGRARSLVLIGCGTFDRAARERLGTIRRERMGEGLRRRMERLEEEPLDPDERLRTAGRLIQRVDSYELVPARDETERYDARANAETWADMLRLQDEGVFPASFATIRAPVLMLHGAFDPHPGPMIRASLEPHLPQLEYRQWERCGHYPWLEKAVRDEFLATLRDWLLRDTSSGTSPS